MEVARHLQRKIRGEGRTLLWSAQEEVLWIKHDHSYSLVLHHLSKLVMIKENLDEGVSCPTRPSYFNIERTEECSKARCYLEGGVSGGRSPDPSRAVHHSHVVSG